jgi:hypothetical protein
MAIRMRLLGTLILALVLSGCMFPQGWHHPRTLARTGSSSTVETTIYVQNDVQTHQGPYVSWAVGYYSLHPELVLRMVDTCPVGKNCIRVWTEGNLGGNSALTGIGFDSSRHILDAWMRLDPSVGRLGTISSNRQILFHEFCHALGGGFGDAIHSLCNWPWRALIFQEISRVYHNDPG